METKLNEKLNSSELSTICVNDVFDELCDENTRLSNELLFANKCVHVLLKFKCFLENNCKCINNTDNGSDLQNIFKEYSETIITKNRQSLVKSNSQSFNGTNGTDDCVQNDNVFNIINSNDNDLTFNYITTIYREKCDDKKLVKKQKCNENNNNNTNNSDRNIDKIKDNHGLEKSFKNKSKDFNTEYRYFCSEPNCNFGANRLQIIGDHRNSHLGIRPYKCNEENCMKTFDMYRNLQKHLKTCHNDDKPVKCNWPGCGAQMHSKKRLVTHMRKHTGEKPYACDWPNCSYKATQIINLQHHQNSKHKNERPYKCTFIGCDASFVYPGSLHGHVNSVHSSYRKYKCDWPGCDAVHKHHKSFIAHKLSHQNIKPFKCDWPGCEYGTRRPELLRNHKYTHTGERNYPCSWPACDKKFKTGKALREHLMIHNDDKRYRCKWPGCEYRCVSSGNLVKHFNVHHKK